MAHVAHAVYLFGSIYIVLSCVLGTEVWENARLICMMVELTLPIVVLREIFLQWLGSVPVMGPPCKDSQPPILLCTFGTYQGR